MIEAYNGPITVVHTTAMHPLGAMVHIDGKIYQYVKGVTSGAAGSWVTFDENYATTLLAANAIGPVGILMAALSTTSKYGWMQRLGVNAIASTDTIAADKPLYIDGTSGRADDAVVVGDLIVGAISMTADSSNVATVFLNWPFVTDALG